MSRFLARNDRGLEAITVEQPDGVGTTGEPAYAAGVTVADCWVRRGEQYLLRQSSDDEELDAVVWVPGTSTVAPDRGARLTIADGTKLIVRNTKAVRRHRGALDHTKAMCREEGVI